MPPRTSRWPSRASATTSSSSCASTRPSSARRRPGARLPGWLGTVPIVDAAAATPLAQFVASILDAAERAPGPQVPAPGIPPQPVPSGTAIFDVAPVVSIPRTQVRAYLREAVLLYPTLRAAWLGAGASADGEEPNETGALARQPERADRARLARRRGLEGVEQHADRSMEHGARVSCRPRSCRSWCSVPSSAPSKV